MNFTLTQEQIKGMAERFATVVATMLLAKAVEKGWISSSDSATLLPAVVLIPSLIYGWLVNRNKSLIQATAAIPGTVVVTQPSIAAATPETNIVSTETTKVTTPAGEIKPS